MWREIFCEERKPKYSYVCISRKRERHLLLMALSCFHPVCVANSSTSSVHLLLPSSSFSSSKSYRRVKGNTILSCSSSANSFGSSSSMSEEINGSKLMEFPHLMESHRDLMVELVTSLEKRFHSHLLPSSVPPDVQFYQNQSATSQGTLHIRSAIPSSPIDFILASWLHLKQPNGGALNITNVAVYLKPTTDVPHFQFELVQCSPTFLIFFLDLIPRKDIVLHPDYLTSFYEQTQLDQLRQRLASLPEVKPYFSSSLYFRSVVSPTGILVSVKLEDGDGGAERLEEIIKEHVGPISKEVMEIWMGLCERGDEREVEERGELEKRDGLIKKKAIEMDLSSTMPLQFGQDVADRVLRVIKSAFKT